MGGTSSAAVCQPCHMTSRPSGWRRMYMAEYGSPRFLLPSGRGRAMTVSMRPTSAIPGRHLFLSLGGQWSSGGGHSLTDSRAIAWSGVTGPPSLVACQTASQVAMNRSVASASTAASGRVQGHALAGDGADGLSHGRGGVVADHLALAHQGLGARVTGAEALHVLDGDGCWGHVSCSGRWLAGDLVWRTPPRGVGGLSDVQAVFWCCCWLGCSPRR